MREIILPALVFPVLAHAQNVDTLSNVAGKSCKYTMLPAAHDRDAVGSILYLLPVQYLPKGQPCMALVIF